MRIASMRHEVATEMSNHFQTSHILSKPQPWLETFAGPDAGVCIWPDEARRLETKSLAEGLKVIKAETRRHHPIADLALLDAAATVAEEQHGHRLQGASRRPEIRHAYAVAYTAARLGADPTCVAASFLHDTLEEGSLTPEHLARRFGIRMARLVGTVSWSQDSARHPSEAGVQRRLLSQALDAAHRDPDLIDCLYLLLAEKLDHVRFSGLHLPREQQMDMARLALKGYSPLAQTLAAPELASDFQDAVLECLSPMLYRGMAQQMQILVPESLAFLKMVFHALSEALAWRETAARFDWRVKRIASACDKMQRTSRPVSDIFDLVGGRVIVEKVSDCYLVRRLVESLGRPVPGDCDDYIIDPKPNAYQSLHIVLRSPAGALVEIQIRTREMHWEAEYGRAAHWRYRQSRNSIGMLSLHGPQNGSQTYLL